MQTSCDLGFYRPAIFHGADLFFTRVDLGSMVNVIPGFSTTLVSRESSAAPAVLHGSRDQYRVRNIQNDGEAFCFDKFLNRRTDFARLMPGFTMRSARYRLSCVMRTDVRP